jgi:guanine nucleotide-binding protein subunit alpha
MSPQPDDDPLSLAMQPPPDETAEQRQVREAAEAEAKRVSDEIDEQIKKEREIERRKRKPVKLLLLGGYFSGPSPLLVPLPSPHAGQSESGKTATLKSLSPLFID